MLPHAKNGPELSVSLIVRSDFPEMADVFVRIREYRPEGLFVPAYKRVATAFFELF